MHLVTATLAVAALALTADRVGRWALRAVAFESASVSIILGLGLLGYVTFALGLLGLLHAPVVVALLIVGTALSARDALAGLRRFAALSLGGKAGVLVAAAMLVLVYLVALRPPTEWDATMYHLAYAKRYAATHHLAPGWGRWGGWGFRVFRQLKDMLSTLAFLAGGEPAPALVELLLAGATAAAVAAWGRRVWSPAVGAWAAALWLGNPLVVFLAATPYID